MKIEDIEKAGKIYIENLLDYHIDYTIINNEEDNYEAGREHALSEFGADIFKAGAEWMKKYFSWISVEERLPESKEKVLVLNRMKHHDKYFVSENIRIFSRSFSLLLCITKPSLAVTIPVTFTANNFSILNPFSYSSFPMLLF